MKFASHTGFISRMALAGAFDVSVGSSSPYPGSELFDEISGKQASKWMMPIIDAYYNSLRSYTDTSFTISYSEHFSDQKLKNLITYRRADIFCYQLAAAAYSSV